MTYLLGKCTLKRVLDIKKMLSNQRHNDKYAKPQFRLLLVGRKCLRTFPETRDVGNDSGGLDTTQTPTNGSCFGLIRTVPLQTENARIIEVSTVPEDCAQMVAQHFTTVATRLVSDLPELLCVPLDFVCAWGKFPVTERNNIPQYLTFAYLSICL